MAEIQKSVSVALSEIRKCSEELEAKSDKISAQLKSVGLPLYDLPPETQLCIQVLAETAYNLQVNNSSPMRISLGMATLLQKEAKLKHDLEELKRSLRHNNIALEKVSTDKDCLLKFSDELLSEKKVPKNRNKDMKFLGQKSQQYSKMASNLQAELTVNEFSKDHQHQELQRFFHEMQSLESRLQPLSQQLKHFRDLPPDLGLAKQKVHEAKLVLEKSEAELSEKMDLITS